MEQPGAMTSGLVPRPGLSALRQLCLASPGGVSAAAGASAGWERRRSARVTASAAAAALWPALTASSRSGMRRFRPCAGQLALAPGLGRWSGARPALGGAVCARSQAR